MALESEKVPLAAGIGLAFIVGAAVLAWLSAPATLRLARGQERLVTAELESRLFGLMTNRAERIDGIRSVSLVGTTTGRSRTPGRIVFETMNGSVNLGRNQQLFAVDFADIEGFFNDAASPPLALSSIARGSEFRRFLTAQAVVLFLMLGGLGLEWSVVRTLLARDRP